MKDRRGSTVNTVHYVSLLPHGTSYTPIMSGSTMLQVHDRQVTECGVAVYHVLQEASMKLEGCACYRPLPRTIAKMTQAGASPRVTGHHV